MSEPGKFHLLDVDSIELDKGNPRIALFLSIYKSEPTPEQLHLALNAGANSSEGDGTTFQSLEQSIKTHRGLVHPIIVNKKPDGKLVAIEGNTRVAIYLRLKEKDPDGPWGKIPAMVHDNLDPAQIDAIRLQSHLVGPRQWDPYSKAKYLHGLRDSKHLTLAQIVEFCGGKSKEIQNYITAYEGMETHYRPQLKSDGEFNQTKFSAFVEVQAPRVQTAILHAGFTMKDFSRWIIDRKIYPLNTVRLLPAIFRDTKARQVFLKDGAVEAQKCLDGPEPSEALQGASLAVLANEVSKRLRAIQFSDVKRMKDDPDSPESRALLEARDQLSDICTEISGGE